jgi:hypothetical protein
MKPETNFARNEERALKEYQQIRTSVGRSSGDSS